MTSPLEVRELMQLESHAAAVVRAAHIYGYPLPDGLDAAQQRAAAARKIAGEPACTPFATLPDAAGVAAWCTKVAAERDKWRGRTAVAAERDSPLQGIGSWVVWLGIGVVLFRIGIVLALTARSAR
jgi:hypothetical protein